MRLGFDSDLQDPYLPFGDVPGTVVLDAARRLCSSRRPQWLPERRPRRKRHSMCNLRWKIEPDLWCGKQQRLFQSLDLETKRRRTTAPGMKRSSTYSVATSCREGPSRALYIHSSMLPSLQTSSACVASSIILVNPSRIIVNSIQSLDYCEFLGHGFTIMLEASSSDYEVK